MPDEAENLIELENDPDVGDRYPLHLVTEENARNFWKKHDLPVEEDILVRGFLAFRHRAYIHERFRHFLKNKKVPERLKIGENVYTKMELNTLWNSWRRGKWETLRHLSRLHWLLIAGCIFAAMTQGWDQAAMAGAAVQAMKALDKPVTPVISSNETGSKKNIDNVDLNANTWLLGFLVGAPFLCGAPIGLLVTDRLTEIWVFGRRGAICVASLFSFVSVIGSASVHNIGDFIAFRVLLGVGMASKASIVPILLSETSPKNVRGVLLVFWQLFVAFGLAAGSVANMSVYHLNIEQSWRYMFISAFIPALLLFSLVLFAPESPRWLLKKSGLKKGSGGREREISRQRVRDALKSLIELHDESTHILAAGELVLLYKRLIQEQEHFPKYFDPSPSGSLLDTSIAHVSWKTRWSLMLTKGRMRRANYAAASVMIAQQLCGINLLAFLAETFFRNSFFHNTDPTSDQNQQLLAYSLGFGAWNFLSTIPALFFIDNSTDRRSLLNWSFPCMAASLLISGLILLAVKGEVKPVVAVMHFIFVAMFTTSYSIGEGPCAFVIAAEVFPLINRELGMSLAVFWNFLGAGLLASLAPALTKAIGQIGVLGLFSGSNLIAWAFCYWLVPNTGNEELEEVFKQFDVPTKFSFVYHGVLLFNKLRTAVRVCFDLMHANSGNNDVDRDLQAVETEWEIFHENGASDIGLGATWKALRAKPELERLEMSERETEQV